MPTMQAMTSRANSVFGPEGIGSIKPEGLMPGTNLSKEAMALGIAANPAEQSYLASFPPGLLEALRAALYSAVERKLPVTFAWAPGYAHEMSLWDVADTTMSRGGMTVFIRSPLPQPQA